MTRRAYHNALMNMQLYKDMHQDFPQNWYMYSFRGHIMIDWFIIYRFTSRSRIFHLYGDVTVTGEGWRAAKFRPMLSAQGLWGGRDLYRATPAVTQDLGFSSLIQKTAPFSHLLRHAWGCGGPILTQILMGAEVIYRRKLKLKCFYYSVYVQVIALHNIPYRQRDTEGRFTPTVS
jgi:hypothetical protein